MSILIEADNEVALLHRGTRRFLLAGLLATVAIVMAIFVRQGLLRQTATLSFVTESAQDIGKGQAADFVEAESQRSHSPSQPSVAIEACCYSHRGGKPQPHRRNRSSVSFARTSTGNAGQFQCQALYRAATQGSPIDPLIHAHVRTPS